MIRPVLISWIALMLVAGLALAEPTVKVRYLDGVPEIILTGSYPNSRYTVWRSSSAEGPFANITNLDILCLGPCYAEDFEALPGVTYWYRFDLILADGAPVSFGPFPVTISAAAQRVRVGVFPNPTRAMSQVELFVAGLPSDRSVAAEVSVFDAQGRRVRALWNGAIVRGIKRTLNWDGRDDDGRDLGAGHFFLRLSTPAGSAITRAVRVR